MATIFVDNNVVGGAGDGSTWPNAYSSISSAVGANAGDEIWWEKDSDEIYTTNTTLDFSSGTFGNPVRVLSVQKSGTTDGTLVAGARLRATSSWDLTLRGNIFCDGIHLGIGDDFFFGNTLNEGMQHFKDCRLYVSFDHSSNTMTISQGEDGRVIFEGGEVDLSVASWISADLVLPFECFLWARGTKFIPGNSCPHVFDVATSAEVVPRYEFDGCDFSECDEIFEDRYMRGRVNFRRCIFKVGYKLMDTIQTNDRHTRLRAEHCAEVGTLASAPLPTTQVLTQQGTQKDVVTNYRTGGADDGEQGTPYSLQMVSSALATFDNPLVSPDITGYVESGSQTLSIKLDCASSLNDNEFWIQYLGPTEEVTPDGQGRFYTSRLVSLGSAAALAADGDSTWNPGLGTSMKIDIPIAPTIAGPCYIRCYLGKLNTTVNVDPVVYVE